MRRRLRRVLLALAALLAVLALPGVAGARQGWHVAAVLGLGTDQSALSCRTAEVCFAVEGGRLLRTADAGTSWQDLTARLPADVAALTDVSCTAGGECYAPAATDTGGAATLLMQGSQVVVRTAPAATAPETIACPQVDTCLASDGATVWLTTDGAQTWQAEPLPLTVSSNAALGCAARTTRCWI